MGNNRTIATKTEGLDILILCKEEYIKHHPEMKHVPISNHKILMEIATFYLQH